MKMKRISFTAAAVLAAMFLATCAQMGNEGVEYTNVIISPDGRSVTMYLDGTKVPVSKSSRALTTAYAQLAYNYLEVVFDNGAGIVARKSWGRDEPDVTVTGIDREASAGVDYTLDGSAAEAIIFVGRKIGNDLTLLGVGELAFVDTTSGATIMPDSKSITFEVEAIKTELYSAFDIINGTGLTSSFNFSDATAGSLYDSLRTSNSKHVILDNVSYPVYFYGETKDNVPATYEFFGAAITYDDYIKHYDANVEVVHLEPYYGNGKILNVKTIFDKYVQTSTNYQTVAVADATLQNPVELEFITGGNAGKLGYFSFSISIPVYALTDVAASNNNNIKYEKWYIRTGTSTYLDNGVDSTGGNVLIGVGSLDEIGVTVTTTP